MYINDTKCPMGFTRWGSISANAAVVPVSFVKNGIFYTPTHPLLHADLGQYSAEDILNYL